MFNIVTISETLMSGLRRKEKYPAEPKKNLRFWRKPTGYELFVQDITRFDGVCYYDLNDEDRRLARYMLDNGYMWYRLEDSRPILHITRLGHEMMEESW